MAASRGCKAEEQIMDAIGPRLDALEMRVAHQDKAIADLNDVITAQWKQIDQMERQLRRLGEELEAMETPEGPAANQRPPHY
jgi:SlyX protein